MHTSLLALLLLPACTADGSKTEDSSADTTETSATSTVSVAADRSILQYTTDTPAQANLAQLPANFTEPDQTVCAEDPTRQYLGEIFEHGLDEIQVDWHWAPVVSGPDLSRATVDQPEWWYAGEIESGNDSDDDVLADHPFGLDYSFDVTPDEDFDYMPSGGEAGEGPGLHCEIEQRTFPRTGLGYAPVVGGRTLLRGVWVLDCGHPPYGAEMHPPTFLAFAHAASATTTEAMTFVAPYRSSLLFNPDTSEATNFASDARFTDSESRSFPHAFINAVLAAITGGADRLSSPALMVANRFEPVDFLVCAPLPRPEGAVLDAQWHFAARTGIDVQVRPLADDGCVRVQATMKDAYVPMELPYASADWSWEALSASAGGQLGQPIDVRQAIIDAAASLGLDASNAPALQPENPPLVDAYAALEPAAGADDVSTMTIETGMDGQPFPFYGRVTAAWK